MGLSSDAAVPAVLVLAGNDPSGGAGLAADCAALLSHGCHPCPVPTVLTVQDTCGVQRLEVVDAAMVEAQAQAVLADIPVAAIKVGVVGSRDIAEVAGRIGERFPQLPLVLDPVLRGGQGGSLARPGLELALRETLLPRATVITPNADEAARLAPAADGRDEQAEQLLAHGCEYVLLTGADSPGDEIENRLYGPNGLRETYKWERIPGAHHGTGCTLASALTGLLAQGVAISDAVLEAQAFTWQAICQAYAPGRGQAVPDRLFWARQGGHEAERAEQHE